MTNSIVFFAIVVFFTSEPGPEIDSDEVQKLLSLISVKTSLEFL
jgi:hypothetical protein